MKILKSVSAFAKIIAIYKTNISRSCEFKLMGKKNKLKIGHIIESLFFLEALFLLMKYMLIENNNTKALPLFIYLNNYSVFKGKGSRGFINPLLS
jgi:hypothetical protein